MNDFKTLASQAEEMLEQRRIRSSRALFERGLRQHPEHACLFAYNLGSLEMWFAGNGVEARDWFQRALRERPNSERVQTPEILDQLEANACENLMLLSLSYDEYDQWADRLRRLQPDNEILTVQLPRVHGLRERGQPWSAVMTWLAGTYLNEEGQQDPARCGAAAATAQLMLANRRRLRLSRQDHREVVLLLAGTRMHCVSYGDLIMRRTTGESDPDEFLFLVEEAVPAVQEYLEANPSDPEVEDTLRMLREALKFVPEADEHAGPAGAAHRPAAPVGGVYGCAAMGAALGAIAGFYLLGVVPSPWNAVIGGAVGLIVCFSAAMQAWRRMQALPSAQGTAAPALIWQTSPELQRAIKNTGLSDLSFELEAVAVQDGALITTFRPLTPPPPGKEHEAGLALRCTVWLTLPVMGPACPDLEIGTSREKMGVALGDGVPVPFVGVRSGSTDSPALQCGSEHEDGRYHVIVHPLMMVHPRDLPALNGLLGKLAVGFEPLRGRQLDLGK